MQSSKLEEILNRGNVKRGQITLLKALYERDDEFISYVELSEIIRGPDSVDADAQDSLSGVLGAFGGQVNSTDGVSGKPGSDAFVERQERDDGMYYRLKPEARRAIERDGDLMDMIQKPMDKLTKKGTKLVR